MTDPNPPVILSGKFGTARLVEFTDTMSDAVVAVVLGGVVGGSRVILEVGDTTASGVNRREVIVDAGSETDTAVMTTKGEEALAAADSMSIEMQYISKGSFTYGRNRDFWLGDIVSVDAGVYGAYDLRIVTASHEWTSKGPVLNLTLGSEAGDVIRMIRDVRREISAVRI